MKRAAVKICGITRAVDAEFAAEAGADAIGFVFWPGSPRAVSRDAAVRITRNLGKHVMRVGVFVNADAQTVGEVVGEVGLDAVQLHGEEPVRHFKRLGVRLIKAVSLSHTMDVEAAAAIPEDVTVLVDATDRERRGGTGQRANWVMAGFLAARRPMWLAGGLTAENVADALRAVNPVAVDVSSGVESAPGVKDHARLVAFLAAVRAGQVEAL